MAPVLVLGALGNVGTEVVKSLIARGARVRAAGRFPDKIRERFGDSVEALPFDFTEPATWEEWLRASGLAWTMLRASFFMQNLNTTHREEIRDRDEIFIPVGDARTSFIDVRDIGAVAALALTEVGHENKAYDLTGAEAFDYDQVAAIFSEVLGRKIVYRRPSAGAFFRRMIARRQKLMFALVATWLYSGTKSGMADAVTGEVERLLGRRPRLMRHYVEDYRGNWERPRGDAASLSEPRKR